MSACVTPALRREAWRYPSTSAPRGYSFHVATMGLLTTAVSKTIRITWAEIVPLQTTQKWLFQGKGATPNSTGLFLQANCAFTVPNGVTITKMTAQCLRKTAGSSATVTLIRGSATGGSLQLAQLNTTVSAAYHQTASSVMNELVTSTKYYVIQFHARTTAKSTATVNSAFLYADVTYTMPHLGAAY